jgi:hypothetical protein
MKTLLYTFLLLSGIATLPCNNCTCLMAQKSTKSKPSVSYKIQIAAYRNLNLSQLGALTGIGNLFAEDAGNGIKRIVMGYYKTEAEALNLLPKVQENGFEQAFVVPHNTATGSEIVWEKATEPTSEGQAAKPAQSDNKTTEKTPEPEKTSKIAQFNADDFPPLQGNEAYAVVLNASDEKITEKLPDMLEWGNVFVPQNDPDATMVLGSFDTPEKALNALDYAQSQVSEQAHICIIDTEKLAIVKHKLTLTQPEPDTTPETPSNTPEPDTTPEPDNSIATAPATSEQAKTDTLDKQTNEQAAEEKDPCDKKREEEAAKAANEANNATASNNTNNMPKEVQPEGIYRPNQAKKAGLQTPSGTATSSTQSTNKSHTAQANTNTQNNAEQPQSILSLPPEAIAGQLSEAPETNTFSRFKTYFSAYDTAAQIVIVPYDATLDQNSEEEGADGWGDIVAINRRLRGTYIPAELATLIDSLPKNDTTWSFYALSKYALDPLHDAYIIRASKGEYHIDNDIYLSVYDKGVGDFTQSTRISTVWSSGNIFGYKRTWIMDLDKDGNGGDILLYTYEEQKDKDSENIQKNSFFTAKVWKDNDYVEAQIVDPENLKQQFGVQ